MSGFGSQRVRRNGSPSTSATKSGPLRATLPVSFMQSSAFAPATDNANNTKTSPSRPLVSPNVLPSPRQSPALRGSRASPEFRTRKSPLRLGQGSPVLKTEKSRTLDRPTVAAHCPTGPVIRRTASLDAIYLGGHWPRECFTYCQKLFVDKATQTPDDWADDRRGYALFRRQEVSEWEKYSRQRLPRYPLSPFQQLMIPSNANPSNASSASSSLLSPSRVAIATNTTVSYPQSLGAIVESQQSPQDLNEDDSTFEEGIASASSTMAGGIFVSSRAIPVPKGPPTPRVRNSVEGFNLEIERLVLNEFDEREVEGINGKLRAPTPDGHRAPIADLFKMRRSVDTQTPFENQNSGSGSSSPCHSNSPLLLGPLDASRPPSQSQDDQGCPYPSSSPPTSFSPELERSHGKSAFGTSPQMRGFLCREPPDGCEKITLKSAEEGKATSHAREPEWSPLKPNVGFVLQPSSRSAFCPLYKPALSTERSISLPPDYERSGPVRRDVQSEPGNVD